MENQNQDLSSIENGQQTTDANEKVELSKEEYEKLISDQKRLWTVENELKASTKEWQKLAWISKVATDNSKFVKLYKSDKKQAEEVAQHFGYSAKDFYDAVVKEYGDSSSDWLEIEDVDERVQQGINRWLAEKTLSDFKEKYWIKWKLENSFSTEFNTLMEWKDRNSDEVLKQCKRALKLVSDTAEFQEEYNKSNSRLAWAGISWDWRTGGNGTWPKTALEKYRENKKNWSLFTQYGISKDL